MVVVTAGTGGGTHKVLLISGKQQQQSSGGAPVLHQAAYSGSGAGVAPLHQAAYSRSISVVLPSSSSSSCQQSSDDSGSDSAGPPMRKRQRLTHLSPEEKALRRKLKNRVAAQTARDRKKAKMGELEQQVLDLELENQQLHVENRLLREKTGGLLTENEELRQRLGLDTLETKENLKVQVLLSSEEEAGLGIGSSESAAGAGPAPPKSEDFTMDTDGPDPTDAESDLLMGILDILDPELFLRSCEQQEECEESEMLLVGGGHAVPSAAPAALGAPPVKLEALNELIHFDHIYTKAMEEVEVVYDGDVEESDDHDAEVKIEAEEVEEEVEAFPVTLVEEEETVVVIKDEPQEVVILPECDEDDNVVDDNVVDFISVSSPLDLSGLDKEACLADAYSDSGYERSPSPFSDMSSPLMCSESSWEDMFANELFPQLISV